MFLLPVFKFAVFQCACTFIIILSTFTVLFLRYYIVFTACTDDETSISKRLNKDDNFTNRLRFNLPYLYIYICKRYTYRHNN